MCFQSATTHLGAVQRERPCLCKICQGPCSKAETLTWLPMFQMRIAWRVTSLATHIFMSRCGVSCFVNCTIYMDLPQFLTKGQYSITGCLKSPLYIIQFWGDCYFKPICLHFQSFTFHIPVHCVAETYHGNCCWLQESPAGIISLSCLISQCPQELTCCNVIMTILLLSVHNLGHFAVELISSDVKWRPTARHFKKGRDRVQHSLVTLQTAWK